MNLKLDLKIIAVIIITGLLIAVSTIYTAKNNKQYLIISQQFHHNNQLLKNAENVLLHSHQLLNGFSGFAANKSQVDLTTYEKAKKGLADAKKELVVFNKPNSLYDNEVSEIFVLTALLNEFGSQLIKSKIENREQEVLKMIASEKGEELLLKINETVFEAEGIGREQLKMLVKKQEELAIRSSYINFILAGVSFLIILSIFVLLQIEFNKVKRATEEIHYLASLIENVKDAIISTGENFKIISWNKGAAEMFGFTEEEARNKSANELLQINLNNEHISADLSALPIKGYLKGEYKAIKKNGEPIYILSSVNMIRKSGGKTEYVSVHKDISERKNLENELNKLNRELEEKVAARTNELKHIFERISDAFVALDNKLCCTYVNKKAGEIFNRYPDTMIGKSIWNEFPQGFGQQFYKAYNEALQQQKYIYIEEYYSPYDLWFENHIYPSPEGLSIYFNDITERKKATEKIRLSESRLAKAQEVAHLGNWQFNYANNIEFWSDEMCRIFGFKPGDNEQVSESWHSFIHQDDQALVSNKVKESNEKLSDTSFTCRILRGDGTIRHIYSELKFEFDSSGKPIGKFGIVHDITQMKLAEELLRQSETKLRAILQTEPECVKLISEQGELLDMNPAGLAMIEADNLEQVIGKNMLSLIDESYRKAFAQLTNDVFNGQSGTIEFKITGLKGTHRWLETHAVPLKNTEGQIISLLGITRDISDRKKSEQRYQSLAEISPGGIFNTDSQGLTTYVNPSWCQITGLSGEKALGYNWLNAVHVDDRQKLIKDWQDAVKGQRISFSEFRFVHSDGSERWVIGHAIPERNSDNEIVGYVGTITDITDRKNAEEELLKSEKWYRGLLNNLDAGIVVHASDTSILKSNLKASDLLGLSEEQLKGRVAIDPDWRFLNEKNEPLALEKYPVIQIKNSMQPIKNFIAGVQRPATKDVVWLIVNGFPVFKDSGALSEVVISFIDITERRHSEEALLESERFLRETQLIANLGTYTLDLISGHWTSSEVLDNIFGIDADFNRTVENWSSIVHPDWKIKMNNYFQNEVLVRKSKFDKEYKIIRVNDRAERWVHGIGNLKFNDSNEPISMVGTIHDITERKQAEEILKSSEEKYRQIVETAHEGILVIDEFDKIKFVNQHMAIMLGYEKEEMTGRSLFDFMDEEGKKLTEDYILNRKQGIVEQFEFKFMKKNGDNLFALIVTNPITEGGIYKGALAMVTDITIKKKVEEEIMLLMNNTEESFVLIDKNLNIINFNHQFKINYEKYFNVAVRPGFSIFDYVASDRIVQLKNIFSRVFKGERIEDELKVADKGNNNLVFLNRYKPSYDQKGNIIGAFVTTIDITKSKKAEEEINRSREELRNLTAHQHTIREEEGARIAREIHDELGQQLTGLKMDASWISKKVVVQEKAVTDKINGMITLIDETVKTVRRIASELRPGILDDLGLLAALEWQSNEFEKRTEIKCVFKSRFDDLEIEKEQSSGMFRIYQEALTNISRHSKATKVESYIEQDGKFIILSVKDNGCGFDVEEIKNKKSLGIIGMKERAIMLQGELVINSEVNKGTELILKVPIKRVPN